MTQIGMPIDTVSCTIDEEERETEHNPQLMMCIRISRGRRADVRDCFMGTKIIILVYHKGTETEFLSSYPVYIKEFFLPLCSLW